MVVVVRGTEEEVGILAITKVEDALPSVAAVPVNPGADGHRRHGADGVRQLHIVGGAVQGQCIAARHAVACVGAVADGSVKLVCGLVEYVPVKLPLCHQALRGSGLTIDGGGSRAEVAAAVHRLYLIRVGLALDNGIIDVCRASDVAGNGHPVVGALHGAHDVVAPQVVLAVGVPRELHGGLQIRRCQSAGSGGCRAVGSDVAGYQFPLLRGGIRAGALNEGTSVEVETEIGIAVVDVETAIACIDKVPLFATAGTTSIYDDALTVLVTPVQVIEVVSVVLRVGKGNRVVTIVTTDVFAHGGYPPALPVGSRTIVHSHVGSVVGSIGSIACDDPSVGHIHNLERSLRGEGLHVLAALDVDDALCILLSCSLIPSVGVGRQMHVELAGGTIAVIIYIAVLAYKAVAGLRGLALATSHKGLHHSVLCVAIDGGSRKCGSILPVGEAIARTIVGATKLRAGMLGGTPPDAVHHAVVGTNDGLHHVV